MGLFGERVAKAQVVKRSKYFEKGRYTVRIDAVKLQKGRNAQLFIVEVEVLDSDNPKIKINDSCSWVIPLDKEVAYNNIKTFVCTLFDIPDVDDEETRKRVADKTDEIVDDSNPMHNTLANLAVVETAQRGDPSKMFNHHNWSRIPEEEAKELKELLGIK